MWIFQLTNNKDTWKTSLTFFLCIYYQLWTEFKHRSGVDFEQANTGSRVFRNRSKDSVLSTHLYLGVIQKVHHSQNDFFYHYLSVPHFVIFLIQSSSPVCHSLESDKLWRQTDEDSFCIYGSLSISHKTR